MCAVPALAVRGPLDYREFQTSTATWLVCNSGILVYSNDSRSMRTIILDANAGEDSIADVAESDGVLWFSSNTGLFQVDMATGTVERVPFPGPVSCAARIAVDLDFVWLSCGAGLWQFDKLSREWLSYEVKLEGKTPGAVRGLYSDEDCVYRVDETGVFLFSVLDEKWDHVALSAAPISASATLRIDSDGLLFVDGTRMVRYIIGSRSWETIKAPAEIVDVFLEDSVIYYTTVSGASQYNKTSAVTRPLDIPGLTSAQALAKLRDTLFVATPKGFTTYDIPNKASNYLEHPPQIAAPSVRKMFFSGPALVADYTTDIGLYDPENDVWEVVRRSATREKAKRLTWDDDGLRVRYAPPAYSELKGSVKLQTSMEARVDTVVRVRTSGRRDTTIDVFVYPEAEVPKLDLTLHSQLAEDRYVDVYANNLNKFRLPNKGIYYRGAPDDRLQWTRLGTNTFDIPYAHTLPATEFEGGAAVVESRKKLEARDRKVVRTTFGGGYVTGQTRFLPLSFSSSSIYRIPKDSLEQIVPGSMTIWVDGEELDSTLYTAYYDVNDLYGEVRIEREAAVDPTSVIRLSYKVRQVPGQSNLDTVFQIVPEPNVAQIGYTSVSISPTEWISPSAGYVFLDPGSNKHLVNVASPTEIRRENLLLKFEPDFTRNVEDETNAAALALRSRFGKRASLTADALFADSGFVSTDNLSRGYGDILWTADFTAGYDILRQLPVRYSQHNSRSVGGTERLHKLSAGVQFENYPMLEIFAARNVLDATRPLEATSVDTLSRSGLVDSLGIDTTLFDSASVDSLLRLQFGNISVSGDTAFSARDTAFDDTVDTRKNKFGLRLYETSSPLVEKLLHLNRFSYEASLTEYRAESRNEMREGAGRIVYGRATVAPTSSITFSGYGTYQDNPDGNIPSRQMYPVLQMQTIDAPPGIDIDGKHEWDFRRIATLDSAWLKLSRSAGVVLRPGKWFEPLRWMSPRAKLSQILTAGFTTASPAFADLIEGSNGVLSESVTRTLGVHIFPTSWILYQNENEWGHVDTLETFKTFNDLNLQLGSNSVWQTRWTFTRKEFDRHIAFTSYRRSWTPWLKTAEGVSVDFTSNTPLHYYRTAVTPKATVSLNFRDFGFVRNLISNNTAGITWFRQNGEFEQYPGLALQFYLRAVIRPNISITTNNSIEVRKGKFDSYNGKLALLFIF